MDIFSQLTLEDSILQLVYTVFAVVVLIIITWLLKLIFKKDRMYRWAVVTFKPLALGRIISHSYLNLDKPHKYIAYLSVTIFNLLLGSIVLGFLITCIFIFILMKGYIFSYVVVILSAFAIVFLIDLISVGLSILGIYMESILDDVDMAKEFLNKEHDDITATIITQGVEKAIEKMKQEPDNQKDGEPE